MKRRQVWHLRNVTPPGKDAKLEAEIERLLVHGIAHLLGHDHEVPHERARMVRAEERLAKAIDLPWPYTFSE